MKKLISILAAAVLGLVAATSSYAIEDQDPAGTLYVSAHVGFAPGVGGNISADYVLIDSWWKGHFTVGAIVGSSGRTKTINSSFGNLKYSYSYLTIAPRATYGLNITDNFEVHTGVISGLTHFNEKQKDIDYKDNGINFCFGWLAGARYYFNDFFGASAELNYSGYMTYVNLGAVLRF